MLSTALRAGSAWGVLPPASLFRKASDLDVPIFVKVAMVALGSIIFGFGLLCFITTYIAGSYDASTGVASGIGAEFEGWGIGFMLNPFMQAFCIFGGLFVAGLLMYNLLQIYENRCR